MSKKLFYYGSTASFSEVYSLHCNGLDESARVATPAAHKAPAISVSCWFKINILNIFQTLVAIWPTGSSAFGKGVWLHVSSANKLVIGKGTGAAFIFATGATNINTGVWYHALGTFDTTNGSVIYLNGVSDGTNANLTAIDYTNASLGPSPAQTYLGGIRGNTAGVDANSFFLSGHIDEPAIWNTRLTAANATALYNGGVPFNLLTHGASANLVSWYRCGDGDTYPTIIDVVGGHNMTMINMDASNFQADVP